MGRVGTVTAPLAACTVAGNGADAKATAYVFEAGAVDNTAVTTTSASNGTEVVRRRHMGRVNISIILHR